MDHKLKATEFSAHLSRSRMGRYLQQQLSAQEIKEVELHLAHCERCSNEILQFIQSEEPQQLKVHHKQLKGKLKTKENATSRKLSTTQVKILRAAAALLLMVVFSFFAVKTVINKNHFTEGQTKIQTKDKTAPNTKKAESKTLPKEQKINDPHPTESSISDKEPQSALAMQSAETNLSVHKRSKEVKPTPVQQENPTVVKPAAKKQNTLGEEKTAAEEIKPVVRNTKEMNIAEEQSPEENEEQFSEEDTQIQSLPVLEKLDIQKVEKEEDNTKLMTLPASQEIKNLEK